MVADSTTGLGGCMVINVLTPSLDGDTCNVGLYNISAKRENDCPVVEYQYLCMIIYICAKAAKL